MKTTKAFIWSILNPPGWHPAVKKKDQRTGKEKELIEAFFPGFEYDSITGFFGTIENKVKTALTQLYPEPVGADADSFDAEAEIEIAEFVEAVEA